MRSGFLFPILLMSAFAGLSFSHPARAQEPMTVQGRVEADERACQEIAASAVVRHPLDAPSAIAAAKSKCLAERAEARRPQAMEQCQKTASRLARPLIPAALFYKDCMFQNGYREE